MHSCSQIVNQKAASNYQHDEDHSDARRRLCRQVNLLAASVICASPLHLAARRVCQEPVALDATEREDGDNDSSNVVAEDVEDELQNRLKYQLSDDASWHSA